MRLSGRAQFGSVFAAATRTPAGPLLLYSLPNELDHPRIGLSVGRSVGNAAKRNRVKRLLREAFRHAQHDWPRGYDVVICARPHTPLALDEYQQVLGKAIKSIHATWTKRQAKS
jgi:ribonuclease P protein component